MFCKWFNVVPPQRHIFHPISKSIFMHSIYVEPALKSHRSVFYSHVFNWSYFQCAQWLVHKTEAWSGLMCVGGKTFRWNPLSCGVMQMNEATFASWCFNVGVKMLIKESGVWQSVLTDCYYICAKLGLGFRPFLCVNTAASGLLPDNITILYIVI